VPRCPLSNGENGRSLSFSLQKLQAFSRSAFFSKMDISSCIYFCLRHQFIHIKIVFFGNTIIMTFSWKQPTINRRTSKDYRCPVGSIFCKSSKKICIEKHIWRETNYNNNLCVHTMSEASFFNRWSSSPLLRCSLISNSFQWILNEK